MALEPRANGDQNKNGDPGKNGEPAKGGGSGKGGDPIKNSSDANLTQLLNLGFGGDRAALEQVWGHVYQELRRMAHAHRLRHRGGAQMQTTALVNQGYLRLMNHEPTWANRRHFFAAFKKAMRFEHVDDVRRDGRLKRGGRLRREPVELDAVADGAKDHRLDNMALSEAIDRLEKIDPRGALLVGLLFEAGLSIDEAAQTLQLSPRTVDRDWQWTKAWLYRELNSE